MAIRIEHDTLFEIRILHHYFLNSGGTHFEKMTDAKKAESMLRYDSREFFEITPTPDCRRLLTSAKCIFKHTSVGLIAGIRSVADELQPGKRTASVQFDDSDTFTFIVELRDQGFRNYTALPLNPESGKMFLFRNMENGNKLEFPALTVNPAEYKNGLTYYPGDMVADQATNPQKLFIAKVKTQQDTTHASDWTTEEKSDNYPVHYVTAADQVRVVREILNYTEKSSGEAARAEMSLNGGIPFPVNFTALPADPGNPRTLQFDYRKLPEGLCTLNIFKPDDNLSEKLEFYLLHRPAIPFGIILIRVKSDHTDYHLTDQNHFLLSPVFMLRFRNRATYWKYSGKNYNQQSVTAEPLPLTRYGIIQDVKVKNIDNEEVDDLPNPSAGMIKTDESRYYSEIHINY